MQESKLVAWVSVIGAEILKAADGTIRKIKLPPQRESNVEALEDSFHREQFLRVTKELTLRPNNGVSHSQQT